MLRTRLTEQEIAERSRIYKYIAFRPDGTSENGCMSWPIADRNGHSADVVRVLMRRRFSRAVITCNGIEVAGIAQEHKGGRRLPWWSMDI